MRFLAGMTAGAALTVCAVLLWPAALSKTGDASAIAVLESQRMSTTASASGLDTRRGSLTVTHTASDMEPQAFAGTHIPTAEPVLTAGPPASSRTVIEELDGGLKSTSEQEAPPHDPWLADTHLPIVEKDRQRPRNLASLHDEFAAQTRDPAWSDRAELQIAQTLTEAAAKRGVVIMDVRCHQTLCEIQALGTHPRAIGNWSNVLHRFRQRSPEGRQFDYVLWDGEQRDGQHYILTILERKPQ